jgi:His-Xaa-Ser system radical SAM maturase HxsC
MLQLALANLDLQERFTLPYGVYKLAREAGTPTSLRENLLALSFPGDVPPPPGFAGYLAIGGAEPGPYNNVLLPKEFSYLGPGDVVRIDPGARKIRVIYRAEAPSNSLLLTERCNHYCVMCSQPPKTADDTQVAKDILEAIPLFAKNTRELILSGGEPTLIGDLFFEILKQIRGHLPDTSVHVLSNGRSSADPVFARRVGALNLTDLMFGVPLYSDDPDRHNFVVQSKGAFDESVQGILNLKAAGVRVEIRVVLHRYTIPTLTNLARYIATNLTFVDHVAFMGLEAMGFARSNWDDLWIDPRDYQSELADACRSVARKGIRTSVYNLPLCWLSPALLPYYVTSISDWKNEYLESCGRCAAASQCGGFFSSNLQKQVTEDSLVPFTLEAFRKWSQNRVPTASTQ